MIKKRAIRTINNTLRISSDLLKIGKSYKKECKSLRAHRKCRLSAELDGYYDPVIPSRISGSVEKCRELRYKFITQLEELEEAMYG